MRSTLALQATAYHEAGHIVAAVTHAITIKSASVAADCGANGNVTIRSPLRGIRFDIDGSDRARLRGERAIIVLLAGEAAQRQFAPRSLRRWHLEADHREVVDLAMRMNGNSEMAEAHIRWLGLQAKSTVQNNWRKVEQMAQALLERQTLTKDQINELWGSKLRSNSITIS